MRALLLLCLLLPGAASAVGSNACGPIEDMILSGYRDINLSGSGTYPTPLESCLASVTQMGAQSGGVHYCSVTTPAPGYENSDSWKCLFWLDASPSEFRSCVGSHIWDVIIPWAGCPDEYTEIASGPNAGRCYSKNEAKLDQIHSDLGSTHTRNSDGNLTNYTDSRAQQWNVTSFDSLKRPIAWTNPDGSIVSNVVYYPDSNVIWSREEAGGVKIFPNIPMGLRGKAETVKSDGLAAENGTWTQAASASTMYLVRDATQLVPSPQIKMLVATGVTGAQIGNQLYKIVEPLLSRAVDALCAVPIDSGLDAESAHDREQRCNAQYNRDENICGVYISNNYTKPGGTPYPDNVVNWNLHRYSVCKASAIRRLGQCLNGETLEEIELIHEGAAGH